MTPVGPLSPFLTPVTAPLFSPGFMVLGMCALRTEGVQELNHLSTQLMKEIVKAQRGAVSSPRSHSKAQKHLDLPPPNIVLSESLR